MNMEAFLDELEKIADAKSPGKRSYLSDFMAGVDPTGTKTFHYGMTDAEAGEAKRTRAAVGILGGLIGGATIVPAVVSAVIEGGKAVKGGPLAIAAGVARGSLRPFRQVARAARGANSLGRVREGKSITSNEISNLKHLINEAGFTLPGLKAPVKDDVTNASLKLLSQTKGGQEVLRQGQKFLKDQATDFAAGITLSSLIAGGSAGLQYRKGTSVGKSLREGK